MSITVLIFECLLKKLKNTIKHPRDLFLFIVYFNFASLNYAGAKGISIQITLKCQMHNKKLRFQGEKNVSYCEVIIQKKKLSFS